MLISANVLTVGKDPEIDFVGEGTVKATFPAAENHNRNVGTKDNPEWEKVSTSWYQFVAFGDVAQQVIDQLHKGDGFKLDKGIHKIRKVEKGGETNYYNEYKILEFTKYEKN